MITCVAQRGASRKDRDGAKDQAPYPEEFRRAAVELVRGGRAIRDVAENIGVSQQTLRNWVKQARLDLVRHPTIVLLGPAERVSP